MDALALLSGDARAFREKVWASRVHLHHARPGDLTSLLSLDDVDRLLTSSALRTPALRVAQDGNVLPASRFTRRATMAGESMTGLVDGQKALALFDAGATLVLQGLHRYWEPVTALVRDLELSLGHPCQANAYLTPPGAQGFARHSDTHDVFVFQTHGHKQWEIVEGGVEGGVERQVLMEPGLSLYLPTGTPHSARSESETSLHVTVGINQVTWETVLREISAGLCAEIGAGMSADMSGDDARLPAGWVEDPEQFRRSLAGKLAELSQRVQALDPDAVVAERAAQFLRGRTPLLRGGLLDRVALSGLDDHTVLARRATSACALRAPTEDGRLVVLLGDRELRMPARLEPVMRFVSEQDRFRVSDLAHWLDPESRRVVARRLVREGLLRIAA